MKKVRDRRGERGGLRGLVRMTEQQENVSAMVYRLWRAHMRLDGG